MIVVTLQFYMIIVQLYMSVTSSFFTRTSILMFRPSLINRVCFFIIIRWLAIANPPYCSIIFLFASVSYSFSMAHHVYQLVWRWGSTKAMKKIHRQKMQNILHTGGLPNLLEIGFFVVKHSRKKKKESASSVRCFLKQQFHFHR